MVGSAGRAVVVSVFLALVATGIGAVVYSQELSPEAPVMDASPAVDASADARAKVAKAKPKAKPARGGKPRVAGHTSRIGGGVKASGPSHTSGAHHGGRPTPSAHGHHATPTGSSYESALDSNNQQVTIGAHGGSDLTDAQLAAPMHDGTFISNCGAPDDMSVTVKVAIKNGHAVGVSVSTSPPDGAVASCIDHHVRGLSWPAHPKMDSFITTY